ncbi:hypothetical protein GCM10027048_31540 [Hymenobacter coalescens]
MEKAVSQVVGAGVLLAVLAAACQPEPKRQAYQAFDAGVQLSLKASALADTAVAHGLERQAIAKYHEALQLDSMHRLARAALGHSYYLLDRYPEAIRWFEASNRLDSTSAPNYRELGLSRISLGQIAPGWADLQRAYRLDNSAQIRTVTADDLYHLGVRAFNYGEGYEAGGELAKGLAYKKYAVSVLQMAYVSDRSRKDVGQKLAELAARVNTPANPR